MKHGRKAAIKRDAQALRIEMSLGILDPLDCFDLCKFLGLEIVSFENMIERCNDSKAILQNIYSNGRGRTISAITVCKSGRSVILYNETHADTRTKNTIVHEVAHYFLGHDGMSSVKGGQLFIRGDSKEEDDEANHFSSCLLIPRAGMLRLMKRGADIDDVAEHYGVSPSLAQMRYNLSGIKNQLAYRYQ